MKNTFLIYFAAAINFSFASEGGSRKIMLTESVVNPPPRFSLENSPHSDLKNRVFSGKITFLKNEQGGLQYINTLVKVEESPKARVEHRHSGLPILIKANEGSNLYIVTDPYKRNEQIIWNLLRQYNEWSIPRLEGKEISFKVTTETVKIAGKYYPFAEVQWES